MTRVGGVVKDSVKVSGPPFAVQGDFNAPMAIEDSPHEAGGRDLVSEEVKRFLSEGLLLELVPLDCLYTWQIPTSLSWLDRFLCLMEFMELFPMTDVQSP